MGSTPVGELGKSFFRVFDLRTILHFIFLFLLGVGGGGGGGGGGEGLRAFMSWSNMQK